VQRKCCRRSQPRHGIRHTHDTGVANADNGLTGDEIVNVEFEFTDPLPDDQFAVRPLLLKLLDTQSFDCVDMSRLVCEQASVGTMLKVDGGAAPLAFVSALSMRRHAATTSMKQLRAFIIAASPTDAAKTALRTLLDDKQKNVGLLLASRLVNTPLEVVPPLYVSLKDDIAWAVDNEIDEAHRKQFKFTHLIRLARCYAAAPALGGGGGGGGKKKKKKQKMAAATDVMYEYFEDEFFARRAEQAFTFGAKRGGGDDDHGPARDAPTLRVVLVLPASALADVADELSALVAAN
jgi:protein BCP1